MASEIISPQNVRDLLSIFSSPSGIHSSRPELKKIQHRIKHLFEQDYIISTLQNDDGQFCDSYPGQIIVIHGEKKSSNNEEMNNSMNTIGVLKPLFLTSRFSRVRGRFVVPVIYVRNKNVARSSTLSTQSEALLNNVHATTKQFLGSMWTTASSFMNLGIAPLDSDNSNGGDNGEDTGSFAVRVDSQRSADISVMKNLQIKYICDLMVEDRKTKLGVHISSSEKVERHNRYFDFYIQVMPYPGCEFFRDYKDNHHCGENLFFDWDSACNANLNICLPVSVADISCISKNDSENGIPAASTEDTSLSEGVSEEQQISPHNSRDNNEKLPSSHTLQRSHPYLPFTSAVSSPLRDCDWHLHRQWDLIFLSQRYFLVMLACLGDPDDHSGLLVHCISGWDRTPLYISWLRLSLWADGEIHQNLNALDMLYLTIAYDWMLFRHQFPDRLVKGEDIFFFCFDFLQYITDDHYSLQASTPQPPFSYVMSNSPKNMASSSESNIASQAKVMNHKQKPLTSAQSYASAPALSKIIVPSNDLAMLDSNPLARISTQTSTPPSHQTDDNTDDDDDDDARISFAPIASPDLSKQRQSKYFWDSSKNDDDNDDDDKKLARSRSGTDTNVPLQDASSKVDALSITNDCSIVRSSPRDSALPLGIGTPPLHPRSPSVPIPISSQSIVKPIHRVSSWQMLNSTPSPHPTPPLVPFPAPNLSVSNDIPSLSLSFSSSFSTSPVLQSTTDPITIIDVNNSSNDVDVVTANIVSPLLMSTESDVHIKIPNLDLKLKDDDENVKEKNEKDFNELHVPTLATETIIEPMQSGNQEIENGTSPVSPPQSDTPDSPKATRTIWPGSPQRRSRQSFNGSRQSLNGLDGDINANEDDMNKSPSFSKRKQLLLDVRTEFLKLYNEWDVTRQK